MQLTYKEMLSRAPLQYHWYIHNILSDHKANKKLESTHGQITTLESLQSRLFEYFTFVIPQEWVAGSCKLLWPTNYNELIMNQFLGW